MQLPADTSIERFLRVQERDYENALAEIKQGKKRSHWMWYIFPQIQGLGFSETSRYYAIKNTDEAIAYINHPVLGYRLISICEELMKLNTSNASNIFGYPDDLKLQSSMTLFAALPGANPVFDGVLQKFFEAKPDKRTIEILRNS